jgi:hypothetical protein
LGSEKQSFVIRRISFFVKRLGGSIPKGIVSFSPRLRGTSYLGFDGYSWHTHADILAELSGLGEAEAIRQFVDDLIGGRAIIAIARVGGKIRDVWVVDGPLPGKYKPDDETFEFRFWDGSPVD